MGNILFDQQIFMEYVGPVKQDQNTMASLFIEQTACCISDLREAYHNDNPIQWHDSAHKLKGMAAFAGAKKLRMVCEEAQNAYQKPKTDKEYLLEKIQNSSQETVTAVQRIISTGGS